MGLPVFQEARQYIEKICTGHIDPTHVHRLVDKAKRLMEHRKTAAARASRPSHLLQMRGDATVIRRPSGLLVPPKYKDYDNASDSVGQPEKLRT
ncbi:MAG: hypothetical protein OEQ29_09535 [Alphaproteobacteria bacterium]|nr:hypothetical protein [Alphaproteobacteria bacterium]